MPNNKEIEIKLYIYNLDVFNRVLKYINSVCEQSESVFQHDIYYSPIDDDYMAEKYPYKWLRIRFLDDGRAELCYKHFYPEGAEQHLYCDEYQSSVSNPDAVLSILSELKMQIVADVEKRRITYKYDRYLISFDTVKSLGNFIEIEVADIVFDEREEQALLKELIKKLNIFDYAIDLRGYPYLIYEKNRES